jgi:hypothetical protein
MASHKRGGQVLLFFFFVLSPSFSGDFCKTIQGLNFDDYQNNAAAAVAAWNVALASYLFGPVRHTPTTFIDKQ